MKREEDHLTIQVAEYLEILKTQGKVLCYSHVPQETFTRSWGIKMKNKRMGVRSGVPDMIIVYPHLVQFLELKREKGGVVSQVQKDWIASLTQAGVHATIAKGWDQAKQSIDSCLEGNR